MTKSETLIGLDWVRSLFNQTTVVHSLRHGDVTSNSFPQNTIEITPEMRAKVDEILKSAMESLL